MLTDVLYAFFVLLLFNNSASVFLISERAWCSTVEAIDPQGPKMVVLRVIHQTGPCVPAHSSNSFNLNALADV